MWPILDVQHKVKAYLSFSQKLLSPNQFLFKIENIVTFSQRKKKIVACKQHLGPR
jgi:hypothetical protein